MKLQDHLTDVPEYIVPSSLKNIVTVANDSKKKTEKVKFKTGRSKAFNKYLVKSHISLIRRDNMKRLKTSNRIFVYCRQRKRIHYQVWSSVVLIILKIKRMFKSFSLFSNIYLYIMFIYFACNQ